MKKNEKDEVLPLGYWYLKEAWFSLIPDRKLREDLELEGNWNFSSAKIRAVPLDDIRDQETLEKTIIAPLIAMSC